MTKWIVGGFVIAAAVFGAINAFTIRKAEARTSGPEPAIAIGLGQFSKQDFWALIDHSALLEANPEAQLADLRANLDHLPAKQIAEFEQIFDATMRQSCSWDLWGAAYLANGGASDDGFEYFRVWLISRGRKVFEAVAADPDRLADLLAQGSGGELEFEDFAYVARNAWASKTGRDWNSMPIVANMTYDGKPSGVAFSENPVDLAKRYPKLWKRFGQQ